jgi:hypothetical protein
MVSVAGFGLQMEDLKWIFLFLFVAMTIVQIGLNPGVGFIPVIDKKVMGYPVCESVFCFAPSASEIESAGNAFYMLGQPKSLVDFASTLLLKLVSAIWVLLKLLVSVMIFWVPVQAVMKWYGFWMPHAIN